MDIGLLILRLLHIFGGVFWVGSSAFALLAPLLNADKKEAERALGRLFVNSKLHIVFPVAALATIVSGILLFMRGLTGPPAMMYGIGGAAAIVAFVLGGAVVGPTQAKMTRLMKEIAGGTPSAEQAAQLQAYGSRLNTIGWIDFALMMVALFTMAIARYVS